MDGGDDSKDTLRQIAARYRRPIVSLLLDIQRDGILKDEDLVIDFLKRLECFYIRANDRTTLRRTLIDVSEETKYIALSYTWNPSDHEDETSGGYFVEARYRSNCWRSSVRNCVFERITKYMLVEGVTLLWIDRHSIPQKISNPATHRQKIAGLQCMDKVYERSEHPVALLGRPLASSYELTLLRKVMSGSFVKESHSAGGFQLSQEDRDQDATDALELLFAITSDLWWQRAWTFQENYKAGKNMTLLIQHPECCERLKEGYRIFGEVSGELCINSVLFSEKATKFCLAFGRYQILLDNSQPMTPTIIQDVEKREVSKVWDRLAIIGNCCSYPVRMDIERLQQNRKSLSLSLLIMWLLNGELLINNSDEHSALDLNISGFLERYSFDKMSSPLEQHSLTFNKGSRFIGVKLVDSGILTKGYIWELGRIIRTIEFNNEIPWIQKPQGQGVLKLFEHRCLTKLSQELKALHECESLARYITTYLYNDAHGSPDFFYGENYMGMMMVELSEAVRNGKDLRLGKLRGSNDFMAVFVWEGDDEPGFVFTSSRPKSDFEGYGFHDTDRHVSLEVDIRPGSGHIEGSPLHLYIKQRWVSGVCFFVRCSPEQVIFPWPKAFKS
ncbi:hypothetical protein F4678DRAFT_486960 [Xylaria arbuscula]|nr:hypothetical protein F4678DRAFT_486960 [Xylaria arbuscula]